MVDQQLQAPLLAARLLAEVRQSMQAQANAQRWVVAVSGGLDSMLLLHLAAQLTRPVVLHVNHQLSPHANVWQDRVRQVAESLGLDFFAIPVAVCSRGGGLEQAARDARYQAFTDFLQPGDGLLLAHHQDDQAETFLLRLLRGAGLSGLGAMPRARALGAGSLLRPLLGFSRQQLQIVADANGLSWVDDESNDSQRFDRNYIRHSLLPVLLNRWPRAAARLGSTSALLQQDAALLEDYLRRDLAALKPLEERWGQSISLQPLLLQSAHQRHSILRLWLRDLQLSTPLQVHLAELEKLILSAEDANACVTFGNCQLRRYRQRLYAMPILPTVAADWQAEWCSDRPLQPLPAGSFLPRHPQVLGLPAGRYQLRFRIGGERCTPLTRQHSQTLKKLLQEFGLEPWLRDRVPLVYAGEVMVAVGDLWLNKVLPE